MTIERDDARSALRKADEVVVRLLVVAEVRLYREGLRNALAARPHFVVVGSASNADEALQQIASHRPDVVIVDMATRQSLAMARTIHEQARDVLPGIQPEVRVIAFGVEELEAGVLECAEGGL